MRNLIKRNIVSVAGLGLLTALFLAGAAHAITDTVFRYSTVQTGYFSIPPTAFVPLASTYQYSFSNLEDLRPSTNDSMCFAAAVYLPHGAKITEMAAWYANTGATLTLKLRRRGPGAWFDVVADKTLPDTGSLGFYTVARKAIATTAANNERFSYHLEYCATNGLNSLLAKARITYTYNSAGD